jgi:hypothetical protein
MERRMASERPTFAALRCGLDEAAWVGEGAERRGKTLGRAAPDKTPDPLPFGFGNRCPTDTLAIPTTRRARSRRWIAPSPACP